jgi:type IV fimbrial biogenesis protein FimT
MKNASKGFTLIELLVTIVVLVILANLAIPNFWSFIQSNRVTSQANQLATALNYARSEAVKRGEIVRICASDGNSGCGSDWANGWLVVVPGGDVLREWEPVASTMSLSSEVGGVLAQGRLDFDGMGAVEVANLGGFAYRWELQPMDCAAGHPFRRTVDVSNVGRVQVLNRSCD